MFGLSESTIALVTGYAVKVGGVLIALFIANLIAGAVAGTIDKRLTKAKFDATLTRFFAKFVRWAILIMAVLACLGVFGIETTSFAAVIGAAGLAVGLAFQGTLGNFAAGIMLLVFRPFKVGDAISAAGVVGSVQAIDLFATTLDTADNRRLIVPNGALFGATIDNINHHPVRRCDVSVGAAYWDCFQETTRAIKVEMDAAGIGIPYNTVDVNLVSGALPTAD